MLPAREFDCRGCGRPETLCRCDRNALIGWGIVIAVMVLALAFSLVFAR